MWSAGNERRGLNVAEVYLSGTEVAVADGAGALWRCEAASTAAAVDVLAERLNATSSKRVRVWLSAELCRPVRLPAVAGELSRKERRRLAEIAAVAQSGLAPPCRVSIDPGEAAEEGVAVVVQESVLAEIERGLLAAGRRPSSVKPWWTHVLEVAMRARPALRALGVSEGKATTILTGNGRHFSAARTVCPVESFEAGEAAFARSLVAGMIPEHDALAVRLDWAAEGDVAGQRAFATHDLVFGAWTLRQEGTP